LIAQSTSCLVSINTLFTAVGPPAGVICLLRLYVLLMSKSKLYLKKLDNKNQNISFKKNLREALNKINQK
jgi:hypothetical protein